MVFRRRLRLSIFGRLRELIWPRMGYRRSARYIGIRVMRLPGSAHAIAGGFAWGAAISFTPFIGLHIALAGLGSWLTRCNILASAIGTVVGNPWTFPFIWAFIYRVGIAMLGMEADSAPPLSTLVELFNQIWHLIGNWILLIVGLGTTVNPGHSADAVMDVVKSVLWPMLVGGLPTGFVVWLAFYLPLRRLVASYQLRRRLRRLRRRKRAEIAGAADGDMPHI